MLPTSEFWQDRLSHRRLNDPDWGAIFIFLAMREEMKFTGEPVLRMVATLSLYTLTSIWVTEVPKVVPITRIGISSLASGASEVNQSRHGFGWSTFEER